MIDGRYVLGERIGMGGMGVVFAATQTALERPVAIKLPRPELRHDTIAQRRFEDEAIATSRLSHPNIVAIFDFGKTHDGIAFLAMRRLHGRPLGDMVSRTGPLPVARAAAIVDQLLAALAELHDLGMVHADVKSDNVLVEPDGDGGDHATLIDFGLVRIPDRPHDDAVSGTLAYLAPEVACGALPTVRADLYGAGCVLHEIVTGKVPTNGIVEPLLPPELVPVLRKALAKDPHERHATAIELAAAIAAAIPEIDPLDAARNTVGDAIAHGDTTRIVEAYLALSHQLVERRELAAALAELTEAIDVVTAGAGVSARAAAPLWRLLVAMSSIAAATGDHARARRHALEALSHATCTRSRVGCARAHHMLGFVDRNGALTAPERARQSSRSGGRCRGAS